MSGTEKLREVAAAHEQRAQQARREAKKCFEEGEKAELAGHAKAARIWSTQAESHWRLAHSQQAEADRLRMMADVYDESAGPP